MNINKTIECAQDGDSIVLPSKGEFNVAWSETGAAITIQKWESGPHQYRLMHKRTGTYVLQGYFEISRAPMDYTYEWRDLPTVEEEPEKPKNDWARPTKWGGRV